MDELKVPLFCFVFFELPLPDHALRCAAPSKHGFQPTAAEKGNTSSDSISIESPPCWRGTWNPLSSPPFSAIIVHDSVCFSQRWRSGSFGYGIKLVSEFLFDGRNISSVYMLGHVIRPAIKTIWLSLLLHPPFRSELESKKNKQKNQKKKRFFEANLAVR